MSGLGRVNGSSGGDPVDTLPVGVYVVAKIGISFALLLVAGALSAFGEGVSQPPAAAFRLVAVGFLVWGVSAAAVRRQVNPVRFGWFQVVFDAVLASALVALTGGGQSPLTVLYFLNIIAAPFLLPSWGIALVVLLDAVSYATVLGLAWSGGLPWLADAHRTVDIDGLVLHVFAMGLVGTLSLQLTRGMRGVLERQVRQGRAMAAERAMLLDELGVGLIEVDTGGLVHTSSDVARRLVGEVEGQPLDEVLPGKGQAWEVSHLLGEQARQLLCSRHQRVDGSVLVLVQDVSRIRQMEAAVQRDERLAAVGKLAAAMAHEIRNPLASLSGAIQIMKEDQPGELHDIALREVDRLDALVEDFLDAARPPRLDRVDIDPMDVVREVVRAFGADARYRERVQVELDGEASLGRVSLDAARFRQVLWNLLLNAAQHMPERGTILVVSRRRPGSVELQVRDSGVGIPIEHLGRIFDPFFTTRSGGTGLGLANVERIVRAHGGSISVYSKPGQGTAFILSLPAEGFAPVPGDRERAASRDNQHLEVLEVDG